MKFSEDFMGRSWCSWSDEVLSFNEPFTYDEVLMVCSECSDHIRECGYTELEYADIFWQVCNEVGMAVVK